MREPIMKKVNGDGITLQLAVWEGQGTPVLCVHGLTANCRCWDLIAGALTPAHRVIAMDLRGRGLSDKPSSGYAMEGHLQDVYNLMDDLGYRRMILMGHSLGAYIAMSFAGQYPEKTEKLVLIDGGGHLTPEQWDKVSRAIKPSVDRLGQNFPSFDAFLETMKQAPFLHPWSAFIENYFRYEIEEVEDGVRSRIHPDHIQEEVANLADFKADQIFGSILCSVLILRATEGIFSPDDIVLPESAVKRMLAEIPNATKVDIGGTNHYSILLQPNPERDQTIMTFIQDSE